MHTATITTTRPTRTRRASWLTAAAALIASTLAPAAFGQVKASDPYYVVVTQDKLLMRCADMEVAYAIAELTKGQVLLADGESAASVRVAYLPTMTAFVRADEIRVDAGAGQGTLTRDSRLKAPQMSRGIVQSWASVLTTPLATGTTLRIIEQAKGEDGAVLGYRVPAPAGARGFVSKSGVRRATPEESEAAKKAATSPTAAPATKPAPTPAPAPAQPKATPTPAPTTPAPTTPAPTTPAATPATTPSATPAATPAVTDLTKPQVPATTPGTTPTTTPPTTTPADAPVTLDQSTQNPSTTTPSATPTDPAAAPATTPAPAPVARPRDRIVDLESSFMAVRRQPPADAELGVLLNEYQRAFDEMDNVPDNRRRRAQLTQRIEFLTLQRNWQDTLRQRQTAAAQLDNTTSAINAALADVERSRVYNFVGQLIPSLVYDGRSLPLMYQIRTVGGPFARTLVYIKPDPALNLESKVGLVVGVIGEAAVDPTLQLNVVQPVQVEPLRAATDALRASQPQTPIAQPGSFNTPATTGDTTAFPATNPGTVTIPTDQGLPPLPPPGTPRQPEPSK
jgi:hypothetical protein